jgi:hypothetical protein
VEDREDSIFLEPDTDDNSRDTEAKCKRFYSCCSEKKKKKKKDIAITI